MIPRSATAISASGGESIPVDADGHQLGSCIMVTDVRRSGYETMLPEVCIQLVASILRNSVVDDPSMI